ncbi:M20 family metallopeptidase [Roseibium sp. CAU 1637]|uniref:M20 family metallopeptidase n=1 Tax=Roseibium limicola TaxID=2816037 RepID=A0A939J8Q5_9HYPH|nr:M20 family metallopeptidase [Roseibium limicola]MBO0345546.1 M20 family metallopeptidase [Roseibium limicola]
MAGPFPDVVSLTQQLVAFDTVNPPGNEAEAMGFCADLLESAGFTCVLQPTLGAGRANLVATRDVGSGQAIAFSGHLDTVPLGTATWSNPPLGGIVRDDRLYGRGASDMKGGVAAFLQACFDPFTPPGGIAVLLTSGEETGCDGARELGAAGGLPPVGALIVAESTDNELVLGHKGVLWLSVRFNGVSAHGAMPELGVNAIGLASAFLQRLKQQDLGQGHVVMGQPTCNVGTIQGGANINSVADFCELTLDLRTNPNVQHDALLAQIRTLAEEIAGEGGEKTAGDGAVVVPLLDLPPVWTAPENVWVGQVATVVQAHAEHAFKPSSVNYFTDASVLTAPLGNPPTIILGPGNPECVHKTNEWISLDRLHQCEKIMKHLVRGWTGGVTQ